MHGIIMAQNLLHSGNQVYDVKHVGSISEGIRYRQMNGQYGIPRNDLTDSILVRAREKGSILIRAPPQVIECTSSHH